MTTINNSPRTATPTEQTKKLQAYILDRYKVEPNFAAIARELNYSETYVKKLYKKALKAIVFDSVDNYRKLEIERTNRLLEKAFKILETEVPLVSAGQVVRDVIEGPNGQPVIDEDGNPVLVKLKDNGPALAAIDRILKIMERRAKILGLDMPSKTAITDPTGEKEARNVMFYLPNNGREEDNNQESDEG